MAYAAAIRLSYAPKNGVRRVYGFASKDRPVEVAVLGTPCTEPRDFAQMLDQGEKRQDACVAMRGILALPHELPAPARCATTRVVGQGVADEFGVAVLYAVHLPSAVGDERNEHAHFVFGTRNADGKKVRELDRRKFIYWFREFCALAIHAALRKEGLDQLCPNWDHRSFATRRIERVPSRHLGPALSALARDGKATWSDTVDHNLKARELNSEYEAVTAEIDELTQEIAEKESSTLVAQTPSDGLEPVPSPPSSDVPPAKAETTTAASFQTSSLPSPVNPENAPSTRSKSEIGNEGFEDEVERSYEEVLLQLDELNEAASENEQSEVDQEIAEKESSTLVAQPSSDGLEPVASLPSSDVPTAKAETTAAASSQTNSLPSPVNPENAPSTGSESEIGDEGFEDEADRSYEKILVQLDELNQAASENEPSDREASCSSPVVDTVVAASDPEDSATDPSGETVARAEIQTVSVPEAIETEAASTAESVELDRDGPAQGRDTPAEESVTNVAADDVGPFDEELHGNPMDPLPIPSLEDLFDRLEKGARPRRSGPGR